MFLSQSVQDHGQPDLVVVGGEYGSTLVQQAGLEVATQRQHIAQPVAVGWKLLSVYLHTPLHSSAGCLTSTQHGTGLRNGSVQTNCTCCHTKTEAADQIYYLTLSQHTDTGPAGPSIGRTTRSLLQTTGITLSRKSKQHYQERTDGQSSLTHACNTVHKVCAWVCRKNTRIKAKIQIHMTFIMHKNACTHTSTFRCLHK